MPRLMIQQFSPMIEHENALWRLVNSYPTEAAAKKDIADGLLPTNWRSLVVFCKRTKTYNVYENREDA